MTTKEETYLLQIHLTSLNEIMPTFRLEALAQEAYGEVTLWGIFSNIFSFSIIICTLYLFDKGFAFYFEFHFLCLGFII